MTEGKNAVLDKLIFQSADAADTEPVFALNKALIDAFEDTEKIEYQKVLQWVHKKIETHIKEYTAVLLRGQKVGYYFFHETDGKMELDDFFVLPPYRNRGIGTAVLNRCIRQTNRPIFLYAFSKNEGAVSLYSRFGFHITKRIKNTRIIMQRD